MLKYFVIFIVLVICLFALMLVMGGCGPDDPPVEEDPIKFVSADPADGSTIQNDATITVTFDGTPEGLKVTGGTAIPGGKTVSIAGPFAAGPLVLGLQWEGEAVILSYTVEVPIPEGMVLVPAGQFRMGREAEDERFDDAAPVHTVYVDAFYMDVYEVTNAQFKAFVDANSDWQKDNLDRKFHSGLHLNHWTGTDYPAGKADHPVVDVGWYAAMAYARWAGKRLPTEAEWEYAARGRLAGQKYPWGDTISPADANYGENVGDTTPVGQYPANGYGLYDMVGNVAEWCLDEYDADFYWAKWDETSWNPIGGTSSIQWLRENFAHIPSNSSRVYRGGNWGNPAWFVGVVERSNFEPVLSDDSIGFRCVKDAAP